MDYGNRTARPFTRGATLAPQGTTSIAQRACESHRRLMHSHALTVASANARSSAIIRERWRNLAAPTRRLGNSARMRIAQPDNPVLLTVSAPGTLAVSRHPAAETQLPSGLEYRPVISVKQLVTEISSRNL